MDIAVFSSRWALLTAGLALAYGFTNAFRDSSTIVASVVSTRALTPGVAFGLCAVFEFLGASLLGSRIAETLSRMVLNGGTPNPDEVIHVLAAAVGAALLWGIVSWWRGWPMSNSQALIGSLTGASWVAWGADRVVDTRLITVIVVLIATPTIGFLISAVLTSGLRQLAFWMTTASRPILQGLHVLGCLLVSAAHGSNNGQLIVAVLALAGAAALGKSPDAAPSHYYRFLVAGVITAGVLLGGRQLVRKLTMKFYRIRDVQGLGAQAAASLTLAGCILAGFPASPTHLISGTIVGAGVAKSVRSVRWSVVGEIALSWIITMPASAALGAFLALLWRAS